MFVQRAHGKTDDMQFLARRAFVTGKGLADVYDVIEKSIIISS